MLLEVRNVNGAVRLDLTAENPHELTEIRKFVEALNDGPVDTKAEDHPFLDAQLRVESAGFDEAGLVESVAIEARPCR